MKGVTYAAFLNNLSMSFINAKATPIIIINSVQE